MGKKVTHSRTFPYKPLLNELRTLSSRSSSCCGQDQFYQLLPSMKGWKKSNGYAEKVKPNLKMPHFF